MRRLNFYLKYALNQLINGGQRVMVAGLAVAFGVMSVTAMTSVAQSVDVMVNPDARANLGGDLLAYPPDNGRLSTADRQTLDDLQADGLISAYSPVSDTYSALMRTADDGTARFVEGAIGIDPAVYPLVGEMVLRVPPQVSFADVLAETGTAAITRDLADRYGLALGDVLRLAYFDGRSFERALVISAIIEQTPHYQGSRLYYSLETAEAALGAEAFSHAVITAPDPQAAADRLTAAGWEVQQAWSIVPSDSQNFFTVMLRGAGVLGLIVGGIGIANTMQVLLVQRRPQVAILKSLGATPRDMVLIFVLEAAILGLIGSAVGAALAVVVGQAISQLLLESSTMLITWTFNPALTLGGVLIGTLTTVLSALYAIVQASRTRPSVVFRQETVAPDRQRWRDLAVFALAVGGPFVVIASAVMGSWVNGVGVLGFALVGLIVAGGGLGIVTWVLLRLTPTFGSALVRMARNNIRRRVAPMLFAMIALFIGVFTAGFAITIIQVGSDQFTVRQDFGEIANLMVYADADESAAIAAFLTEQGASILDADPANNTFQRGQASVLATVSTAQEQAVAQAVGQTFPRSMVLTQTAVTAEMDRLFLNLLGFALAMAGLALLAGVMLMANVVSLAMIERRYEVGVMKAVGYTRRHVLTVIGLEYGLIGLVAGLLGAVGVQIMVTLISAVEAEAQGVLIMNPLTALLIIGLGVGLTVVTALASAWGPTQVRPLMVLGDRPA